MLGTPTLSKCLDWTSILPLLGCNVTNTVLPHTTNCPINNCGGHLTLYQDDTAYGVWTYCEKCEFAGDLFLFAMACWPGLDVETTLKKLVAAGVGPSKRALNAINIEAYKYAVIDKLSRFKAFWQKARANLAAGESSVLRSLQKKHGLITYANKERWTHSTGLFIGGADKPIIETVFHPIAAEYSFGRNNNSANRIFIGANWLDNLVIPFHDMPNRISSCLLIGRDGRIPEDTAFGLTNVNKYKNAGLACYAAIKTTEKHLVVMNDPLLAVRLQHKYMQQSSTPAPIVSIFTHGRGKTLPIVWQHINKPLIFWGKPSVDLFAHAKVTNSKIAFVGFQTDGPQKFFMQTPPDEWLQRVESSAKPWDEALEDVISTSPVVVAEKILVGLELTKDELTKFINNGPESLRLRIEPCSLRTQVSTITIEGKDIREDNNEWILDSTDESISNGILRIDQVIYHERDDTSYYAGRILFGDAEVKFCDPSSEIETSTFTWMRRKLLKAGAGYLVFWPRWEPHVADIAMQFHPPEVIKGFNSIGWHGARACFVFPSYIIDNKGLVIDDPSVVGFNRRVPALTLDKPSVISAEDLETFPHGDGAAVFWATVTCVLSNILAPVFGEKLLNTAFVGDNAQTVGRASALLLGCYEHEPTGLWTQEHMEKLDSVCVEHRWPLLIKPPTTKLDSWVDWLIKHETKNCMIPVDPYTSKVLATRANWNIIETGKYKLPAVLSDNVQKIVPAFLQYVIQQKFKLPRSTEAGRDLSFTRKISVWIKRWLRSISAEYAVTNSISRVLNMAGERSRPKRAVRAIVDLLCMLFEEGELTFERNGFIPQKKTFCGIICIPDKAGATGKIFIPTQVFNKVLKKRNIPQIDPRWTKQLIESSGAGEFHIYCDMPGFLLSEQLWTKRLDAWCNWYKYNLRVSV